MKRGFLLFLLCFPLLCGAKKLRPLVWVLDAGHGGRDVGCESRKYQEKDITLEVTKEVAALIRKHKPGIKLILTRETDEYLSLDERCQKANRANADLFLSIHVNTVEWKPLLCGTETFFASTKGLSDAVLQSAQSRNLQRSEMLAWLLQKNYYEAGRPIDRGAKPEKLYVLRHTMMPAALTEIGFLSNKQDEVYMTSKKGQKEIALCIYNALAEYYKATQEKTEKKTLANLRTSGGKRSGLKIEKVGGLKAKEERLLANSKQSSAEVASPAVPAGNESQQATEVVGADIATQDDNPPLEQQWAESALAQAKRNGGRKTAEAEQQKTDDKSVSAVEPATDADSEKADVQVVEQQETVASAPESEEQPLEKNETQEEAIAGQQETDNKKPDTKTDTQASDTIQSTDTESAPKNIPAAQLPNPNSPAIPVFSIQIVAVSSELKVDDERLKGLYPVTFVKSGNMFKGLYGGTTDYKKAKATLASIRGKFPDAFIVAYLGEEPISTSRALEMTSGK